MCEKCHPDRQGESWDNFLKRYRIKNICDNGNGWTVESTSGSTYHVRSEAKISREDGGLYFITTCDCPARKRCRHIDAVVDMRHAEELASAQDGDCDGMEIIERTN